MNKPNENETGAQSPNDLKLRDRRSWRGLCVVGAGLLAGPEAQAVTAEPVRCSAWLGVIGWSLESASWVNAPVVGLAAIFVAALVVVSLDAKRAENRIILNALDDAGGLFAVWALVAAGMRRNLQTVRLGCALLKCRGRYKSGMETEQKRNG